MAEYVLRSSPWNRTNPYDRRLLKWASHPDNTSIKTPRGGILNVALADPASLYFDTATGYLSSREEQTWVVSTLLGETEFYNNTGNIRQISITPFSHGWYRFAAVLGEVLGKTVLYFQSWEGGITFGTNRFNGSGESVGGRRRTPGAPPISGSVLTKGAESRSPSLKHIHG